MTGDIAYQQSFDGSADVTGVATLSNTGVVAGSYPVLTVDAKGRVTSGRALATTDIPVDLMNRIKYLESMVTILSSRP
jgi:phage-related tail fiber protein